MASLVPRDCTNEAFLGFLKHSTGGRQLQVRGRQTARPRRGQRSMTCMFCLLQRQSLQRSGSDRRSLGCQSPGWGHGMWPADHCHLLVVSYEKAASLTSQGVREVLPPSPLLPPLPSWCLLAFLPFPSFSSPSGLPFSLALLLCYLTERALTLAPELGFNLVPMIKLF